MLITDAPAMRKLLEKQKKRDWIKIMPYIYGKLLLNNNIGIYCARSGSYLTPNNLYVEVTDTGVNLDLSDPKHKYIAKHFGIISCRTSPKYGNWSGYLINHTEKSGPIVHISPSGIIHVSAPKTRVVDESGMKEFRKKLKLLQKELLIREKLGAINAYYEQAVKNFEEEVFQTLPVGIIPPNDNMMSQFFTALRQAAQQNATPRVWTPWVLRQFNYLDPVQAINKIVPDDISTYSWLIVHAAIFGYKDDIVGYLKQVRRKIQYDPRSGIVEYIAA